MAINVPEGRETGNALPPTEAMHCLRLYKEGNRLPLSFALQNQVYYPFSAKPTEAMHCLRLYKKELRQSI